MRSKVVGLATVTVLASGCASTGSWSPSSIAQENHIYAGAALGQSDYSDSVQDFDNALANSGGIVVLSNSSSLDTSGVGFGATLGYRLSPFAGTEIAYYRLGRETYNSTSQSILTGAGAGTLNLRQEARTSGVGLSALGFLPIRENWELYGRGGILLANTDLKSTFSFAGSAASSSTGSADSTDLFVGLGGSYYYNDQWDIRLEFQRFLDVGNGDTGETDIDFVGLQVLYSIF